MVEDAEAEKEVQQSEVQAKEETTQPIVIEKQPADVSAEQIKEIEVGEYVTISQIANKLGFTHAWIQELVAKGRIKGIKPLRGHWRVPKSEYEKLIKEGVPPLPRQEATKPQVTEILVDKKVEDKIKEPEKKKEPPGSFLGLDFSALFGTGGKK